jgi:GAF domain-containing protein
VPSGFAIGEGVAGRVLQENRPINVSNIGDDPAFISRGVTFGSLLVAPISWRSACIGTISVASQHPHAFTRRNERFLTSLANLAAIAIENARLYEDQVQLYEDSQEQLAKVERRNRELNSLRDILGALQSTLSLPEVLAQVATGVVEGLNYRAVMLATIDEANQLLTVKELALEPLFAQTDLRERAEKMAGQKLLGSSASLQENQNNLGIQVCLDGEARVTQTLADLFQPILGADVSQTIQDLFHLKMFAVMPIKSESRLFGVLYAGTERTEIEGPHLEALQAFANQAALAINNARQFEYMHERLRRRVKELQGLQDIDRLISSTADFERMLHSILEVSLKLVDAECGNIALMDKKLGQLLPKACYPPESILTEQYHQGLTAWVARQRKTIRIRDLTRTAWRNVYQDIEVRSELAVPILVREEVVGVINMGSSAVGAFTEEDESLLDILATQTAVAIQMTRYYQELEKTRQRSYEAERLAAMSDMASNMVHNINNSIGAIRVLVQQIRFKANYGSLSPEFLAKKLESIEHSAEKTLEMARNIRNPFQNLATEPTDINKSLRAALQSFEPRPSTLELILELADKLPPVLATQQLEEVFRNLIKNAIQSMKGMGTLHISSKHTGHKLEVAVTDTGPGISHDLTETSVFNLGVSSKSDGLGYGLWWCKIYLNRVGGAIDLDQSVTAGCRFVITLPVERVTERT